MNFKIEHEEIEISCDNYNIKDNTVCDSSICIDCEDNCTNDGYLIKFIVDDKVIHQYERYEMLHYYDTENILNFVERLSEHLK